MDHPHDRLPPIPEEQWTDLQREYAKPLIAGPRGRVAGPFVPLLRSPELMDHVQRLGEYLRYRSVIAGPLSELAILITARHWSQALEWAAHEPIAEKAGIPRTVIDAVAAGRRPAGMSQAEAAVHDFSVEMHTTKKVSDDSYSRALALFGEQGVVDLMGILGYYSLLAIVLNGAQTQRRPFP